MDDNHKTPSDAAWELGAVFRQRFEILIFIYISDKLLSSFSEGTFQTVVDGAEGPSDAVLGTPEPPCSDLNKRKFSFSISMIIIKFHTIIIKCGAV